MFHVSPKPKFSQEWRESHPDGYIIVVCPQQRTGGLQTVTGRSHTTECPLAHNDEARSQGRFKVLRDSLDDLMALQKLFRLLLPPPVAFPRALREMRAGKTSVSKPG